MISATATSAIVRYGFNVADKRTFKLSSGAEQRVDNLFGRITFNNLTPDTEYTLSGPLADPVKFRTQKPADGKLLFKAGVISDPHITLFPDNVMRLHTRSVSTTAALVKKFNVDKVDFIFVAGDLTDRGRPSEVEAAAAVFKNAEMPVFITRGNYDNVASSKAGSDTGSGKDFEYIIHKGVKFDQSEWIKRFGRPSGLVIRNGVQIAWLNTPFGVLDLPENVDVISKIDDRAG